MEISQLIETLRQYDEAVAALKAYRDSEFPRDSVVSVSNNRYKVFGVVFAEATQSPTELRVLFENGTIGLYPLLCCSRSTDPRTWPEWIVERIEILGVDMMETT